MNSQNPQNETPLNEHEAGETIPFEEESQSPKDPLEQALFDKAELQDQFLRLRAEMDNFRKRSNRERDEERKYAGLRLIADLLPAIDNLKRAVEAGKNADSENSLLLQGVEMVTRQFDEILERNGAKPIDAVGQPFDPNFHEALQQIPSAEHPPMTVLQEYEKGFQMHDRVIRPSKVIVSSAPPVEPNEKPNS